MIDFTNLPTRKKSYGGANGNKICVIINDYRLPNYTRLNLPN